MAREHKATKAERKGLRERVVLKYMGAPKGVGVVARRDLARGEFVGVLPGRVLCEGDHDRLVESGLFTGKYAMATCGRNLHAYVVEPEAPRRGQPARRFRSSMGHFMNEPSPHERLNVVWAFNAAYDPERIECYTLAPVGAGGELLVHYGDAYDRTYEGPSERPPLARRIEAEGKEAGLDLDVSDEV